MRPYSSTYDDLFAPVFAPPRILNATDGAAWVAAMLDAERALAEAQAHAGLIPPQAAAAIAAACRTADFDATDLAERAATSASPVIPLVTDLSRTVPEHARPYVHFGATSQDIMDTAMMLVAHRTTALILADLSMARDSCADLAERHRETLMAGRTLGQHAAPTSFGLVCAGWLAGTTTAAERLAESRARLAVQLGGPVGTLADHGPHGGAVLAEFAARLGLAEPDLPWHTERSRVTDLAATLATATGALGKIATDVTVLSATEVGELAEPRDGRPTADRPPAAGEAAKPRGGSSAMPHKRNPVHSVIITANARRASALAAAALSAMDAACQRPAGAWQSEWQTVTELLRVAGGAAAHAAELLPGLRVDTARMRANLDLTGGLTATAAVATLLSTAMGRQAAHRHLTELAQGCLRDGADFRRAVLSDPLITEHVEESTLAAALDPAACLTGTGPLIDRALAAHRRFGSEERPAP